MTKNKALSGVPMNFDTNDGADATMDGRTPINAGPDVPPKTDANFDMLVENAAAARIQVREQEHATALSAAGAEGARDAALATLQAMISGNPGDTVDALKFRGAVQDMVLQIHAGSATSRPPSTSPRP